MDRIKVSCQNGHPLKADRQLCGTTRACPKCGVDVKIPLGAFAKETDPLSDTGIMRILGSQESLPRQSEPAPVALNRPCPRCDAGISVMANVCEHCHCYVGAMPNFLKRLLSGTGSKTRLA